MGKSLNLKELNDLADEIARATSSTEKNITSAVHKFAILIHRKSIEKIQKGQRSGKISARGEQSANRRRGTGRRTLLHQASAAGEPPKTDTGRLVSSIRPVFYNRFSAEVGSLENIAEYGGMLETGTSKMAARPWLEPTLKENSDEFTKLMDIAIKTGGLAE